MNLEEYRIDHIFYSVDTTTTIVEWSVYKIPEDYKYSQGFVTVEKSEEE